MAFEDNIFDLAYSVRLLNRVGTKQVADRIVGEAARVTKVGGYILFEMTNSARLHRGKGTVAFTKGEFEQILRKWNLDVTHVEGAFVLGIGPWTSGGRRFHNVAEIVDRVLLRLSPSLGARIYFTAKVGER